MTAIDRNPKLSLAALLLAALSLIPLGGVWAACHAEEAADAAAPLTLTITPYILLSIFVLAAACQGERPARRPRGTLITLARQEAVEPPTWDGVLAQLAEKRAGEEKRCDNVRFHLGRAGVIAGRKVAAPVAAAGRWWQAEGQEVTAAAFGCLLAMLVTAFAALAAYFAVPLVLPLLPFFAIVVGIMLAMAALVSLAWLLSEVAVRTPAAARWLTEGVTADDCRTAGLFLACVLAGGLAVTYLLPLVLPYWAYLLSAAGLAALVGLGVADVGGYRARAARISAARAELYRPKPAAPAAPAVRVVRLAKRIDRSRYRLALAS